jgi:predicted permease
MALLLNIMLPVFLVAGAAALVQRHIRFEARTLSRAAFYLFAPALVFDSLSSSSVSGGEFGGIAVVVVLTTLALWALAAMSARLLRLQGPTRAAFLVSVLIMNAGNYGLPVNLFAFGEEGLARASLYFTISALLAASLGVFLSARGQSTARLALRRLAGVPMPYAAALGILVNLTHWTVPEPLAKAIHLLGQASVPLMLTVLGIRLIETFQRREKIVNVPALVVVAGLRLLVAPLLALLFARFIGLGELARNVTILETAMPTAVVTTILAGEFETDPPFAALSVLSTTLLSLITVTIVLNLLA